MSKLTATNTNKPLGTNSKFTFTFSEAKYNARFIGITDARATDPKGTFSIATQVTPGLDIEFNWNPTDATFQSRVKDRKTFNITVEVTFVYEYQNYGSSTWHQITKVTGVAITRSFTDAMAPTLATGAFSVAPNNAGTAVSTVSGYVGGYSKVRASYNSSKVTLKTGATAAKWTAKFGSVSTAEGTASTTTLDSAVLPDGSVLSTLTVTCTLTDSRGFTAAQSFQIGIVRYVQPGGVTANSANFGGTVTINYGVTSGSGAQYYVETSVTQTNGTVKKERFPASGLTTNTSTAWTPSVAAYAPVITNKKQVTATIDAYTYSGGVLFAKKTTTVTLTFVNLNPTIGNGAFTIAPLNTGAVSGKSGYIQGYSKIRATLANSSLITMQYNAVVSKMSVTFNGTLTAAISTTADSDVITANPSAVFTVTDSRGFTATKTLTGAMIPYTIPSIAAKAYRVKSSGGSWVPADDGTAIKVEVTQAKVALISSQNTIGVTAKVGSGNAVTVPMSTPVASGTNLVSTGSVVLDNAVYAVTNTYSVAVTLTDSLGNMASQTIIVPTETWAIHFMTGVVNGIRTIVGAAVGMVSTAAYRFQIPETWKFYRGSHIVYDEDDIIPFKMAASVLSGSYIRYPESGTDDRITADHIGIINPYYTTGNLNTYFFTCQCANGYANIYVRDKDGNQVTAGTNINLAGIFIKP